MRRVRRPPLAVCNSDRSCIRKTTQVPVNSRFGRLSPAEIAGTLIRDHEYAEAEAHAAASLSDGSIGRALEGATDEFVDARRAAASLLELVATASDPGRRLSGAKAAPAGHVVQMPARLEPTRDPAGRPAEQH